MTVTPGKIGEWLKSYLLKEIHGTPVIRSAPILLAERLTDGLGLLMIAMAGLVVFGREYWPVAAIFGVGSLVAIGVSRHRPTSRAALRVAGRVPVVRRFIPHFEEFYESTYLVMEPRSVVLMTMVSVGSWFCEVLAFYLTLIGLGVDGGLDTLFKAAFILPIATLAAAVLLGPGGLGVAEVGITGLTKAAARRQGHRDGRHTDRAHRDAVVRRRARSGDVRGAGPPPYEDGQVARRPA